MSQDAFYPKQGIGSSDITVGVEAALRDVFSTDVKTTEFHNITSANINGSAGAFVALGSGAALGYTIKSLQISYTAGEPLQFGVGASAGAAVKKWIINQGDGPVNLIISLSATDKLWVKSLSTTAVSAGYITVNFMG